MLIELFKMYDGKVKTGVMRKKVMWDLIAKDMNKKGYNVLGDQVSGRWKTLLRGYKKVKDHNQKSGNDVKTYEYQTELDELLGNDPCIVPTCTISSKRPAETDDSEDNGNTADENHEMPKSSKKRRSNSKEMVDLLKVYMDDQDKRRKEESERSDRMHTEKMAVLQGLVQAIANQNSVQKNDAECVVCMDKKADTVFCDCGHFIACMDCAHQCNICPMCRASIVQRVKVFKS